MEVLFITHAYPPRVGGMQKQSYELVSGVSRMVTTHLIVCERTADLALLALTIRRKVRRVLAEHPALSIIHLNDGLMAFVGLPLLASTKIPIVVTLHGLDIVMPGRWYQSRIVPRFRRFAGVIAVSRATAQECLDRGFDKERVFTVPNGVDAGLAGLTRDPGFRIALERKLGIPLSGKHLLVSIGRPVPRKGFSWFLREVMPLLGEEVVYLIIGPRDRHLPLKKALLGLLPRRLGLQAGLILGLPLDEAAVRTELERPEMRGRAYFLGNLPGQDVVRTLKEADLFIMPNRRSEGDMEGFGLVALEAAVCGLPVLAAGIEGITEAVIEGENGYLLPPEDPAAWQARIGELLADKEALRAFGERAQRYTARHFSWQRMCEEYLSVFTRVCAAASGGPSPP